MSGLCACTPSPGGKEKPSGSTDGSQKRSPAGWVRSPAPQPMPSKKRSRPDGSRRSLPGPLVPLQSKPQ
jgi:hypothetical protein